MMTRIMALRLIMGCKPDAFNRPRLDDNQVAPR
jgi:hypothetical protein